MSWSLFAVFLAACAAAALTGILFKPGRWYESLAKPSWTPPDWLFPIAWTILYILMALAAARVASLGVAPLALALWALQITLNAVWTPVFFGLGRIGTGAAIIGALWLAVLATLVTFWQADMAAGWMLAPYFVWVTYAGALNVAIWRLNPDPPPRAG